MNSKISEAVAVAAGISRYGVLECNILPGGLEQLQATGGDAKLYLHPQPEELAEQQGLGALAEEGLAYFERSGDEGDRQYVAAIRNALAATSKQQVGEVQGDALEAIDARFRSGNSIPVERASVPREEWESLKAALAARQRGAQVPAAYRTFSERMRTIVSVEDFGGNPDRMHEMAKECGWTPLCAAPPARGIDLGQQRPLIARSLAEWHEDDGNVMWWAWCGRAWAGEPAWFGTPNDSDWPGYHTHWTQHPSQPALIDQRDAAPEVGNG